MNPIVTNLWDIVQPHHYYTPTKTIDILHVGGWGNRLWGWRDNLGLAAICVQYKVKELHFNWYTETTPGLNLWQFSTEVDMPFMFDLNAILIEGDDAPPILRTFLSHSKVNKLTWHLAFAMTLEEANQQAIKICDELVHFGDLVDHPRVRTMQILWPFGWNTVNDDDIEFKKSDEVQTQLERNRAAWKQCQDVTILLLGLVKRKQVMLLSLVGRDVMKLIAPLVWLTRGTKVWTPKDTL
jgi:hypothetical protein